MTWRGYANAALATRYARLFARITCRITLRAPDFTVVRSWRRQQEAALRARAGATAGMDDAALDRFIDHYERISRHMLTTLGGPGEITVSLAADRTILAIEGVGGDAPADVRNLSK